MKKAVIIFTFMILFLPAPAQEGKPIKAVFKARSSAALTEVLGKQVARQAVSMPKIPVEKWVRIGNLPGSPTVRVRLLLTRNLLTVPDVLSARVPEGNDMARQVFSENWTKLSVPLSLNGPEPALYRGMRLRNLEELTHILTHGLEINKTRFPALFFSSLVADAVGYSAGYRESNISVVVKVPVQPDMLGAFKRYWVNEYVFPYNMPADKLSEVMVFMEVEGKGNWYKACVDKQGLLLEAVPSRVFKREELVGHYFNVPVMSRSDDY